MSNSVRYLLLGVLSLAIVVLDQVTKLSVMESMRLHESIPVITNFFSITYIRIPGAAFGFLSSSSSSFRFVFFGVTSIFAVGLLGTILVRMPKDDWMGRLSVAAILGGAIGNLIDRIQQGYVVDFLQVRFDVLAPLFHGGYFPSFNIADSAITLGAICLILDEILRVRRASCATSR